MIVIELVVKKEEEKTQRAPPVQVPACVHTLTKSLYLCGRVEAEPEPEAEPEV